MTKTTRYFTIGSALFLVFGLSVGLVAYYGGFPGLTLAQGAAVDELRFVPADASVVAYVNVRDVMNSEFRKKIQTLQPAGSEKGQQEFRDQTGINIETDIESVLAYMAPGAPAEHKGVVLARGHFDENKIHGLLMKHGAREESYKGKTLFVPADTAAAHSGGPGALSFLEAGLVAVGTADTVKRTIDVHASGGGGNVLGNPELVKLIDSVKGNSNAWAVGRFDALTGQAKLPAQVVSQIPDVTWFTASGRVNGGVACDLSMETKDQQAAQNLTKVIDGFIALGQLQMNSVAGAGSGVQDIIKSLKLQTSSDGKRVAISFAVSSDLLETVKRLEGVRNKKRAPGAPEPPKAPEPPQPPDVKR